MNKSPLFMYLPLVKRFLINLIRSIRKINRLCFALLFPFLFQQDLRFIVNVSPLDFVRKLVLRCLGASIGKNTYIRSNFYITSPNLFSIGNSSRLARNCSLYLYAPLGIGNYVHAGSGLTIHTSEHLIHSNLDLPIVCRGSRPSPVTICDNVYIGSNVTILSGVTINSNVVIAAGSIVISDLDSGFIYGGVPAKRLRSLKDNELR